MRLEIELRFILFPLIILELFLQLYWSPPVVNSIDWTWIVYIRSHSWQRKSEHKPSHEVEGIVRRAPRQDCVKTQIWGTPTFLNRRSLEPPRLFLELAAQPNWAILGEGPCQGGDQEPNVHSDRALEFLCGDGRTFQKDHHLCSTLSVRHFWWSGQTEATPQ